MTLQIRGSWSDGRQAKTQPVVLHIDGELVQLDPPLHRPCSLSELNFSAPLGNTPRFVAFPDGSQFETTDNATLDALLNTLSAVQMAQPQYDRLQYWVHWLESRWLVALGSALLLLVLTVWFARDGAPLLAREIAARLPPQVSTYIGRDSLSLLDKGMFAPSTLPADRQKQLQQLFAGLVPSASTGRNYRLQFRHGGHIGANAFALPDATIVMTDELVGLAEDDQQLAVVLLHEIGHVEHAHLLRLLIQQAGLAAALTAITGDISGASSMVLALPGVLVQAQYSQDMELEADEYAHTNLAQHGVSPQAFAQIMRRMEAAHPEGGPDFQYLSTHPATEERIRKFSVP